VIPREGVERPIPEPETPYLREGVIPREGVESGF